MDVWRRKRDWRHPAKTPIGLFIFRQDLKALLVAGIALKRFEVGTAPQKPGRKPVASVERVFQPVERRLRPAQAHGQAQVVETQETIVQRLHPGRAQLKGQLEFLARQEIGDQFVNFVRFGRAHGYWCKAGSEGVDPGN